MSHKELLPLYRKWYPPWNNYVKVIPEDIEISTELLLHMFMDDGTSYQRRKESKIKQIKIMICSDCFSRDNQEMFSEKVFKEFGLKIHIGKCFKNKNVYRMSISQFQVPLFYEIIGPPPVPSLAYKWK